MPKKNKIVVTGGAGFVGTNLIKLLLKKTGHKIISIESRFITKNFFLIKKFTKLLPIKPDPPVTMIFFIYI